MLFKFGPNQVEQFNVFASAAQGQVARYDFAKPPFSLCEVEEPDASTLFFNIEFQRLHRHFFPAAFVEAALYGNVARINDERAESHTVHDINARCVALSHCSQRSQSDTVASAAAASADGGRPKKGDTLRYIDIVPQTATYRR